MPIEATIYQGTLPLLLSGPRESRGERGMLDSVDYEILADPDAWEAGALELGFSYEARIAGYHSMWVRAMDGEPESDLAKRIRIQCVGLIRDDEKRRERWSVAGMEFALGPLGEDPWENITISGYGTGKRWNIREPYIVGIHNYFTTIKPPMDTVGTEQTPPGAPTAPPFRWNGYPHPVRGNYPAGWVLDHRDSEQIFRQSDNNGLWAVTDTFGFYQPFLPD